MAKPTYLVTVVHKGREADFRALRPGNNAARGRGELDALCFIEPVKASNRREAMVLVRARYPEHLIATGVVKDNLGSRPMVPVGNE